MSVKYYDYTPVISARTKIRASIFLRMIAEDIEAKATPITPKKTGQLRRSVIKQVLGLHGEIRWQKAYAAAQERGYTKGVVRNYTTPGTGKAYAERAVRQTVANSSAIAKKAGLV